MYFYTHIVIGKLNDLLVSKYQFFFVRILFWLVEKHSSLDCGLHHEQACSLT